MSGDLDQKYQLIKTWTGAAYKYSHFVFDGAVCFYSYRRPQEEADKPLAKGESVVCNNVPESAFAGVVHVDYTPSTDSHPS